jgi:hypothetical protein
VAPNAKRANCGAQCENGGPADFSVFVIKCADQCIACIDSTGSHNLKQCGEHFPVSFCQAGGDFRIDFVALQRNERLLCRFGQFNISSHRNVEQRGQTRFVAQSADDTKGSDTH